MPTDKRLFFLMHRANRVLTAWVNTRTLDAFGVSSAQLATLYYVAKHPECSASDIADVLDINKSAVSSMVQRLERAELLERQPNPKDGRAIHLSLTARGEAIRLRSLAMTRKLTAELTQGFTEGEVDTVARFLSALVERCSSNESRDDEETATKEHTR